MQLQCAVKDVNRLSGIGAGRFFRKFAVGVRKKDQITELQQTVFNILCHLKLIPMCY